MEPIKRGRGRPRKQPVPERTIREKAAFLLNRELDQMLALKGSQLTPADAMRLIALVEKLDADKTEPGTTISIADLSPEEFDLLRGEKHEDPNSPEARLRAGENPKMLAARWVAATLHCSLTDAYRKLFGSLEAAGFHGEPKDAA